MIIISPLAVDDIEGISSDIASSNHDAAIQWLDRLEEILQLFHEHPEVGELREGFGVPGCRSFSYGMYVIFFRRRGDDVEIARVVHGRRDLSNL